MRLIDIRPRLVSERFLSTIISLATSWIDRGTELQAICSELPEQISLLDVDDRLSDDNEMSNFTTVACTACSTP